ncbi:MAG: ATP-binding protein [Bacteroidaceae bacterium]|nr:ATP-binding protein [Bacteroidaceae bacterium]
MKRTAIAKLYDWKEKSGRKPLIIRGARQVGKTWLMKAFAEEAFSRYVYINFEDDEVAKHLFEKDFDIERIILSLQIITGQVIDEQTLILFDELQEAPRGVTSLKYFYEKAPQYPIIAAGSLLGISLHKNNSFPVGKVEFMDLYPLSFPEFLDAVGESQLHQVLQKKDWGILSLFHDKLKNRLRQYYYIGGMPEAVKSFVEHKDYAAVTEVHQAILDSYDQDFSKHAPLAEVPRLRMVWRSIVAQLSKENRKFIYGLIKEGARAKEFELAIEWLSDAGLVYKVTRTKKGLLPLSTYEDIGAFKLFMLDVGLMRTMAKIPMQALLEGDALFCDFKGVLTEQYVMQQLRGIPNVGIHYWSAENSRGELDFLVQQENLIHPIEVKAEENLQSKSLSTFVKNNPGLHGIRFSMSLYREQDWMTNYPLYAVQVVMQ